MHTQVYLTLQQSSKTVCTKDIWNNIYNF